MGKSGPGEIFLQGYTACLVPSLTMGAVFAIKYKLFFGVRCPVCASLVLQKPLMAGVWEDQHLLFASVSLGLLLETTVFLGSRVVNGKICTFLQE